MCALFFQTMPSHMARGYNIPRRGTALFQTYGMDDAVSGEYTIYRHNINEIVFRNGWANFCNAHQLGAGSLIAVRVEMREASIGLFVARIRWRKDSERILRDKAFVYVALCLISGRERALWKTKFV